MTNLSEQLETLLSNLLQAHEELLALAHDHREALSRADTAAVHACTARHADLAARIEHLEIARARLVRALAPASPSPTITNIAQSLPEPARARIIAAAAKLKELLIRVQRELAVLRAATHSLVGHMEGLMQQVARVLTQAGTYGRQGKLDSIQPLPAGLDIRQ
jgi:hypothetical protein